MAARAVVSPRLFVIPANAGISLRRLKWIPAFAGMTILVGTALTSNAQAQELKTVRNITVTGTAERKVVPDQATLQVTVSGTNADLAQAKTEHDQKLRRAMEIIKAAGIAEAKIGTGMSNVQPISRDMDDPLPNNPAHQKQVREYKVMTQLVVTVQPLDKVGNLLEKLTPVLEDKNDAGWNWQGALNLNYSIADENKLRDDMASDAIKNARVKAEHMATAAGASLGAVLQVTEGNAPSFRQPVAMMAMSRMAPGMASPAAVAPPAGEEEVNATVTVSYELKN